MKEKKEGRKGDVFASVLVVAILLISGMGALVSGNTMQTNENGKSIPTETVSVDSQMEAIQGNTDTYSAGCLPTSSEKEKYLMEIKKSLSPEEWKERTLISLDSIRFYTDKGEPQIPREMRSNQPTDNLFIVQFIGPIKEEWIETLESQGVIFLSYIPNYAYIAEIPQDRMSSIDILREIPFIQWIGAYQPAYRIDPCIYKELGDKGISDTGRVDNIMDGFQNLEKQISSKEKRNVVHLNTAEEVSDFSGEISKSSSQVMYAPITQAETLNLTVLVLDSEKGKDTVKDIFSISDKIYYRWHFRFYYGIRFSIDADLLQDIAKMPDVYWIEPYTPPEIYDEVSSEIVGGNWTANIPWDGNGTYVNSLGYDGTGVVVSVADTGIDDGDNATMHPDLAGRIDAYFDYTETDTTDGIGEDTHGHGTHCAGIVAGNGSIGTVDGDGYLYGIGVAPNAHLVDQRIFDDSGWWAGPAYAVLTSDAVRSGAYIGSNSWGANTGGAYTVDCSEFDALVRDADPNTPGEQAYVLEFSAGNSGPSANTVGSPAAAKNVITTGASLNYRPGLGGWPSDNIDAMVDFSSRGPCDDGRIKPDIVAPGTWIASLQSSSAPLGGLWGSIDNDYQWCGGTSQAGPHVSGGAALFVQYYSIKYGTLPSPAMVKAALINGADDMPVVASPSGGSSSTGPIPNNDEGWGRLNLSAVLAPQVDVFYDDQSTPLTTGNFTEYSIYVGSSSSPLKVTLTWTDASAAPNANPALVNNLDLLVIAPDGTTYYGNQFTNGWSDASLNSTDNINNVEAVYINPSELQLGKYIIRVVAVNVPQDGVPDTPSVDQDYAIVISYKAPSSKGMVELDNTAYKSNATAFVTLADSDLNTPGITDTTAVTFTSAPTGDSENITLTEIDPDSGIFVGNITLQNNLVPSSNGLLDVQEGDFVNVTYSDADDGTGNPATATDTAVVDDTPPIISNVTTTIIPYSGVIITWDTDEMSDSTVVYGKFIPPDRKVNDKTPTTTHSIRLTVDEIESNTKYWFKVQSRDVAGNLAEDDNITNYYWFISPRVIKVAIFKDGGAWGFTSNEDILNFHYILYDVYGSADMGVVNLSEYDKVIIVSDQATSFYDAVATNQGWFENYISNGGVLQINGADNGWAGGQWTIMPGGFTHVNSYLNAINIVYPDHPILTIPNTITDAELDNWYSSTHGYFDTMPPITDIVLTESSNMPVCVESYYGKGRIIASMQPLEWGWDRGYSRILENIILYNPLPPPVGVHITPLHQTGFGLSDENVSYRLTVTNIGINGPDTFDITSTSVWPVSFYDETGTVSLTDTDGDGTIDTGKISPGSSLDIVAKVSVNGTALPLDFDIANITATSSLDTTVSDSALLNTTVPIVPPWFDDMETGKDGWNNDTNDPFTIWQLGKPDGGPGTAYSPINCWGTNNATNYANDANIVLLTPPLDLRGMKTAVLTFQNWYSTETGWDGGFLEISTDRGSTWNRIAPVGGYPYTNGYLGGLGGDGYSGSSAGWEKEEFNLDSYVDNLIMIKFHFGSDGSVTYPGWYIDDVNLFASTAGVNMTPESQGGFGNAGTPYTYTLNIENTGNMADTFDITYTSVYGWTTEFYDSSWNPLTDTDGDTVMDTGLVPSGSSVDIFVNVTIPPSIQPENPPEVTTITATSSNDALVNDSAILSTYVLGDILLVDDDNGIDTESWYTDAVNSTGFSWNLWNYQTQGAPDLTSLEAHNVTVWFTGNDKGPYWGNDDPLTDEDRAKISAYLDNGGRFYLSSEGAGVAAIANSYTGFMSTYFGYEATSWWWQPDIGSGIADNPIGDMLDLEIYQGDCNWNLDGVGTSGTVAASAQEAFTESNGGTVGTNKEDVFRTVHTSFDFAAVNNQATRDELMYRILCWLYPPNAALTIYPDQTSDGANESVISYPLRVRNMGKSTDTFDLSASSSMGWLVELYDSTGTTLLTDTDGDTVVDTGSIASGSYVDITVKVTIPPTATGGDIDETTITATSSVDNTINDNVTLRTTIPWPGVSIAPDLRSWHGDPGEVVSYELTINNTGGVNDTFDLTYSSSSGWTYEFYDSTGTTLLVDTDGDAVVDTGNISGLSSVNIVVKVTVDPLALQGELDIGTITATSSIDTSQNDTATIITGVPVIPPYFDDFEGGTPPYPVDDDNINPGTQWEWGDPSAFADGPPGGAYSPNNCWGTNLLSNYTWGADIFLYMPYLNLTSAESANLTFWHWYNIDSPYEDGGWLEISTDNGENWVQITPEGGYPSSTEWGVPGYSGYVPAYAGTSAGWENAKFNLSMYVGQVILIRFRFWSEPWNESGYPGWYIDDVRVSATYPPVGVRLLPKSQSDFGSAGSTVEYTLTVTNTGSSGPDSFDLTYISPMGWTYEFYDSTGTTLLTDTDGTGIPDTGSIASNGSVDIIVKANILPTSPQGSEDEAVITATSFNNNTINDTAILSTAVPYTLPYLDDMESGEDAWTHYWISGDNIPDNWAQSTNRNHSANTSWYSGIEVANWANGGDTALVTPYIDLTGGTANTVMTFWHWYYFDGASGFNPDGGIVEIWDNITRTWTQITPKGGYDGIITTGYDNPLEGLEAFTYIGGESGWLQEEFDISAYVNKTVQFRFHVGWDYGTLSNKEGWYIDDIYVGEPLPGVDITPDVQSGYGFAGDTISYNLTLENKGITPDTFDLTYTSPLGWTYEFYDSTGTVPLTDTDGDGTVDTGSVAGGGTIEIVVNVTIPASAVGGELDEGTITATSSVNTSREDTCLIRTLYYVHGKYYRAVYICYIVEYYPNANDDMLLYNAVKWTANSTGHINVTVIDSWGTDYGQESFDTWASGHPDVSISYLDKEGITYEDLVCTNADVLIISDAWYSGNGWEYTDNEISTIQRYCDEGHGIIATSGSMDDTVPNNVKLGSIFGLVEQVQPWASGFGNVVIDDFTHPVTAGLPSSYTPNMAFTCTGMALDTATQLGHMDSQTTGLITAYDSSIPTDNLTVTGIDKAPANVNQGDTEVLMEQLTLSADTGEVTVTSIKVDRTGTGADSDIAAVRLYDDINDNGVYDVGTDIQIGADQTFVSGHLIFSNLSYTVSSGTTKRLLVLVDFSDSATPGVNVGLEIVDNTYITVSAPDKVNPFATINSTRSNILGDTTPPQVSWVIPGSGSTGINISTNFTIKFSEPMNPQSVESAFTYTDGSSVWDISSGTVVWNVANDTMTFNPSFELSSSTTYWVSINASYAKDLSDNFLDGDKDGTAEGHPIDTYTWNFTTETPADDPPTVSVLQPNGGEKWYIGTDYEIQWSAGDDNPLPASPINITYSTDGGTSWIPIANGLANTGTYTWTVPNTPSTNCLINITCYDSNGAETYDLSDGNFTIVADLPPTVEVVQPDGGEVLGIGTIYQIKWNASDPDGAPLPTNPINITYSTDGGTSWIPIANGLANTATYNWLVPDSPSTNCLVNVSCYDSTGNEAWDLSNLSFEIMDLTPPQVVSHSPTGASVPTTTDITIRFNEPMNETATESAFELLENGTIVSGTFTWTGGENMTFSPDTNLEPLTTYTVILNGSIARDVSGNTLDGDEDGIAEGSPTDDHIWQFTTEAQDTSSPVVVTTIPADGAIGVSTAAGVYSIQFSEPMNTSAGVTVTTDLPGATWSWSADGLWYNASYTALTLSTTYNVDLTGGGFVDLAGNALTGDITFNFTTASGPTSTATGPTNTAPSNIADITITYTNESGVTFVSLYYTTDNGTTWQFIGNDATIDGSYPWTIPADGIYGWMAVSDGDIPPTGGEVPEAGYYIYDGTSPSVLSTNPADSSIDVPVNQNVVVVFGESMNTFVIPALAQTSGTNVTYTFAGWNTTNVANDTATWTHTVWNNNETIGLTVSGAEDLAGNVQSSYSWSFTTATPHTATATGPTNTAPSNVATITITYTYDAGTTSVAIYYTIDSGTTWNFIGNDPTIDGSYSWTIPADGTYGWMAVGDGESAPTGGETPEAGYYTYDGTAPTVISTDPANGAIGVPVNQPVVIRFSEPMDISTFNFTCSPDPGGWSVSWNSTNEEVTLTHTSFALNTLYWINITSADDVAGNTLAGAPYSFNFTTELTDTTPPTVISHSPAGTDVPVNSQIVITFNESMNTSSVESAFSISPSVTGTFSWNSANATMTFTPASSLSYGITYTVVINASVAVDINGNALDGNGNGIAEGSPTDDYTWTFTTETADTEPPTSSISAVSPYWHNTQIELTLNTSDNQELANITLYYRHSQDNGTWSSWTQFGSPISISGTSWTGTITFTFSDGGGYYQFYTIAKDAAGNNETKSNADAIAGYDTSYPQVSITSPSEGMIFNTENISVSWSGNDSLSGISYYLIKLDDGYWINVGMDTTREFTGLSDGTHTIYVRAADRVGHQHGAMVNFTLDTAPPEITITSPSEASLHTGDVQVTWHGIDATTGIEHYEIRIDEGTWIDGGTNTTYRFENLTDGTHTVYVKALDIAGNEGTANVTFTVDGTAPRVTDHFPTGNDVPVDAVITVTFSEEMEHSTVQISVNGITGTLSWNNSTAIFTPSTDLSYATEYTVHVTGSDLAGNQMDEYTWSFTTTDIGTITGRVVDENGNPIEGATVTLDTGETATTDENGEFSIQAHAGNHTITVSKEGYETETRSTSVSAGEVTELPPMELPKSKAPNGEFPWLYLAILIIIILAVIVLLVTKKRRRTGGREDMGETAEESGETLMSGETESAEEPAPFEEEAAEDMEETYF